MTKPLAPAHLFRNDQISVDSSVLYAGLINTVLPRCSTVLDIGCGRGQAADDQSEPVPLLDFRRQHIRVIGLDVDPRAKSNPLIDEFRLIDSGRWPVEASSVDLIIADWTLEHVEDPDAFASEVKRCLRPGGVVIARSVNRRSLLAAIARIVPNRLHQRVLARLQPRRQAVDVFPTCYRMNTPHALRQLLNGFDVSISWRPGVQFYVPASWGRIAQRLARAERLLPATLQSIFVVAARLK